MQTEPILIKNLHPFSPSTLYSLFSSMQKTTTLISPFQFISISCLGSLPSFIPHISSCLFVLSTNPHTFPKLPLASLIPSRTQGLPLSSSKHPPTCLHPLEHPSACWCSLDHPSTSLELLDLFNFPKQSPNCSSYLDPQRTSSEVLWLSWSPIPIANHHS